jgi:hypothetical protein
LLALLLAGVELLPAAEPPIEPNEKPGLPVAAPKRLPDAGAVDVVLLLDAPEELVFPKLNDILGVEADDQLARIGRIVDRGVSELTLIRISTSDTMFPDGRQ